MSAHFLPRLALRQSQLGVQRRAASSTSEAVSGQAAKAKEGVSEVAGKAQQGLSRVTTSAGSAVSSAASTASRTISSIGGRTGSAISFVQSLVPPTIYYARVGGELAKMMVQGRGMTPPTMQTVQTYLTPVQNALRNPSALLNQTSSSAKQATQTAQKVAQDTAKTAVENPQSFLTRLRNLDTATLTTVGVVTAETIGFFSVGEMLGRFKIVGYRSSAPAEHH